MPNWQPLGPAKDYPDGTQVCLTMQREGKPWPVVLIHAQGQYFALHNCCPHAGLPLGEGQREGLTLTCPYHGYTYHLQTGADLDDPQFGEPASVYPVRVQSGMIEVDL